MLKKILLIGGIIAGLACTTLASAENYACNRHHGHRFTFAQNNHRRFVCVYNEAWDSPLWCAAGRHHCGGHVARHSCHRGGEKFGGGCLSRRNFDYFNRG